MMILVTQLCSYQGSATKKAVEQGILPVIACKTCLTLPNHWHICLQPNKPSPAQSNFPCNLMTTQQKFSEMNSFPAISRICRLSRFCGTMGCSPQYVFFWLPPVPICLKSTRNSVADTKVGSLRRKLKGATWGNLQPQHSIWVTHKIWYMAKGHP